MVVVLVTTMLVVGVGAEAMAGDGAQVAGQPTWWIPMLFGILTVGGAWLASRHLYVRDGNGGYRPALSTLQIFSIFLLFGAAVAQFWVHGDPSAYHATMHANLGMLMGVTVTPHFLINDVFMCLFFGIAAKELAEAVMKEKGMLRGKKGILPLVGCIGGMIGPAFVFWLLSTPEQAKAWAVPCATDIAFAWLGARVIWGKDHPATLFLLAFAIGDDFGGMAIIAVVYPQHAFHATGLLMIGGGMGLAWLMRWAAHHHTVFRHWLPYAVPAVLCWFGLLHAGLHAALALVFVVPFMPMEGRDKGIFGTGESGHGHDTMNRFEHAFKPVVDVGLMAFGLANAGVAWIGYSTWTADSTAVFLGLGIGKTVGITVFTLLGYGVLRFLTGSAALPNNPNTGEIMRWRDVPVVGVLGAMGFTVALFVADAAGGAASLKIGALASFFYLGLAIFFGKIFCSAEEQVPDHRQIPQTGPQPVQVVE